MMANETSKHKTRLLLQMANAVEESNARSRQRLHHGGAVDAETVDQLLWELEQEAPSATCHDRTTPSNRISSSGMVQPQQVHFLYRAMIRYRENAELRYKQLELRHLDLSQAFMNLESRYRTLESQQEAWKQSCEALQKAAAEGDVSSRSTGSTSNNMKQTQHPSSLLQNSSLSMLQGELKILSGQRNQLAYANLELRKQLKQMQIQMQTPREGEDAMTATCRRCHPELLAGRQQAATDTLDDLVERFHRSSNHGMNDSSSSLVHQGEEIKQGEGVPIVRATGEFIVMRDGSRQTTADDVTESEGPARTDSSVRREEHKFEDSMNLLGMQLGGSRPQRASRDDPIGLRGSQHQMPPQPIKQTSIVWSPAKQEQKQATPPRSKPTAQMVPTINTILPMQKQPQPKKVQVPQQDIHVTPRRGAPPAQTHHSDLNSNHHLLHPKDIHVYQDMSTLPVTANEGTGHFGRSASYRNTSTNSPSSSNHSGITVTTANTATPQKAATRFRRISGTLLPGHQQVQHQTPLPLLPNMASSVPNHHQATPQPRQRRSLQEHSIVSPSPSTVPRVETAHARHLEYCFPGTSAPLPAVTQHSSVGAQPHVSARHLEFASAPTNPAPSIMRGPATAPAERSVDPVRRRVAQPVLKRPEPPQNAMFLGVNPVSTRNYDGVRNPGPVSRMSSGSNMRGGGLPNVAGPLSTKGVPLMPNNRDYHQHSDRAGMPSQQHQQPSHQIRLNGNEEKKPEKASWGQSYFERIKKTLQQEI
jgi:hypothetical protein